MDRTFSARTEAEPDDLYEVVADLGTYPSWLPLVHRAEPETDVDPAGGEPAGGEPAWIVTLRARIGPLARSKRLRMVRTVHDGRQVRFERRELDGRDHSAWTLEAEVRPVDGASEPGGDPSGRPGERSEVLLDLRYGGKLWSGLLDGVLDVAADDATRRLQEHVAPSRA